MAVYHLLAFMISYEGHFPVEELVLEKKKKKQFLPHACIFNSITLKCLMSSCKWNISTSWEMFSASCTCHENVTQLFLSITGMLACSAGKIGPLIKYAVTIIGKILCHRKIFQNFKCAKQSVIMDILAKMHQKHKCAHFNEKSSSQVFYYHTFYNWIVVPEALMCKFIFGAAKII